MKHVVAISGGKDSTAMALLLATLAPREYIYLITPTGDELPELEAHWANLETLLGTPFTRVTDKTLADLIYEANSLPNWRQRWCTRLLKVEPAIRFVKSLAPATMYVGLRADEEEREGSYSAYVTTRYPLREWGMTLKDVEATLDAYGVHIPARTDCARCYAQRLSEWKSLYENHPTIYAEAAYQEEVTGHTFRSPGRDKWPASLVDLAKEFASGRPLRGEKAVEKCRPCTL